MPMPREEDDDLFPSAADVDFVDEDEKPKKKAAGKKGAGRDAEKPAAKKAAPKKKVPKKKTKSVTSTSASLADDGVLEARVKPARKKRTPKADAPAKPPKRGGGFGAGLFDDTPAEEPAAEEMVAEATTLHAPDAAPGDDVRRAEIEPDPRPVDEYGRPEPVANYVVHVYELGRFKRTVEREFTPEAAEAFATEYSRTSRQYGRRALAGKKDTQPAKELA